LSRRYLRKEDGHDLAQVIELPWEQSDFHFRGQENERSQQAADNTARFSSAGNETKNTPTFSP
jgi:hypothetical protein